MAATIAGAQRLLLLLPPLAARNTVVARLILYVGFFRRAVRGLRPEPDAVLTPPRLTEQMRLDMIEERQQAVFKHPLLLFWVRRISQQSVPSG
jgi:hypothetical protein